MEVLKAGREPTKIDIECPHCGARYRVDQRHVVMRWINTTNRQAIVMTQCRHCINPFLLTLRQQEEMGITGDILNVAWLLQLASWSERGKCEFNITDEGGFIAQLGGPKLSPTIALQGATPPQSPQQCETASPGSFEAHE
jgi:hypothetical protein